MNWYCPNCGKKNMETNRNCIGCALPRMTDAEVATVAAAKRRVAELMGTVYPQWDYLQATSEMVAFMGGLSCLGHVGWELVGISTYEEGGTMLFLGTEYKVKALYVFKRPLCQVPADVADKLEQAVSDVPEHLREAVTHSRIQPQQE